MNTNELDDKRVEEAMSLDIDNFNSDDVNYEITDDEPIINQDNEYNTGSYEQFDNDLKQSLQEVSEEKYAAGESLGEISTLQVPDKDDSQTVSSVNNPDKFSNATSKMSTVPNEIGRVTNVGEDKVLIRITTNLPFEKNLIDTHVIFETNNRKIVGTVTSIDSEKAIIKLVGELNGYRFLPGVIIKPAIGNVCLAATQEETKLIVVDDQNQFLSTVLLGNLPLYGNAPANVSINGFFSNHFAIFGNSGSGKSCGVARLLQNVFFYGKAVPKNASIFMFDAYGEYESALSIQNSNVLFKRYSTNVKNDPNNLIKIPLWLLDLDDIALLLDVDDQNQLPILEKALRLVTVFSGSPEEVRVYKNDIIAQAVLEVLYSGRSASQIHDQIFAILTSFNTPDLNLETPIAQPGYVRSLRQCLIIDKEGKIGEIQLVSEFIKKYINPSLKLELPDGSVPYTLENLREALDFALISEGILKSDKVYDKANVLKVRLDSLIKGEYAEYFKVDKYIDKMSFIKSLITAPNGGRAQIININISYLDDRLAKTICKIYSRLLFDFTSKLQNRGSFPVHIILEEAHRYVQKDTDINILGYNIFDRIAKEGRKYGVILGLISQRPSELSETALSQCSNFLIFKMQHPHDVSFIRQMVPNITDEIVEKLKGLQPGTCIAFGSAFKLPMIVKMELPNPVPMSQNVDISKLWY